jgi:hypothetical protein
MGTTMVKAPAAEAICKATTSWHNKRTRGSTRGVGREHDVLGTGHTVTKAQFGDGGGRRQEGGVNTAISQKRVRKSPRKVSYNHTFGTPDQGQTLDV